MLCPLLNQESLLARSEHVVFMLSPWLSQLFLMQSSCLTDHTDHLEWCQGPASVPYNKSSTEWNLPCPLNCSGICHVFTVNVGQVSFSRTPVCQILLSFQDLWFGFVFNFMCMCFTCMCICALPGANRSQHIASGHWERITDGCEPPRGFWESSHSS